MTATREAGAGQGLRVRAGDTPGRGQRLPTREALVVHALLIGFVVLACGPVLLILLNSMKTTRGIFGGPFVLPNADTFSLEGYSTALSDASFPLYYLNSIIVTGVTVVLTAVCASLAAYALAEYRVRMAGILTLFFLFGIMLPIRLGTVTIVQLMVALGINDTLLSLILVYSAMSMPLAVALMATYFRLVPHELKEAARIDGAGELRTMRMTLPIVRPGIAAVCTMSMLPIWNDLWFPLILASGKGTQTVTLGVQQFIGQYATDYPALLAALVMGAVPIVVIYVILSRQFIRGLSAGYGQ